ncbi:DUF2269 family protein [Stigmatella aurantiaca]|uniref:Integral membrane protein n=1 Tax=Stigmatella aurantiaca (strain DW4/3-1) TaxID=378806 RepID=Q08Y81_STIAD|nr:DUF2269 family protein [Stigmatella aurantiaca]EAU65448.1 hypothetical protein STIAU_2859 [Stigmatella aurantiaca DW4/3-1]
MSQYNVLVFVHLVAAFLMIGGNTVARIGLTLMRSATHGGEVLGSFRTYAFAPRLIGPSVAVTVLTGLTLAWYIGYTWRALWVSGSVLLWIALNIWRAVVLVPPAKRLQAAVQQAAADPVAHGGALMAAARNPRLHWGHVGVELTNGLILALMVFKPMTL